MTDGGLRFVPLAIRPGLLLDLDPIQIWGWTDTPLNLPAETTAYGMVTVGQTQLADAETGPFTLRAGMFFALPERGAVRGGVRAW
jgi:hypothetical protein